MEEPLAFYKSLQFIDSKKVAGRGKTFENSEWCQFDGAVLDSWLPNHISS